MKEKAIEFLKALALFAVFMTLFLYFSKPAEASSFKPTSSLERPFIVGYIANKAGGRIMLTTEEGDCKSGLFFYTTNDGGRILVKGCYTVLGQEVFATASDGSMYQYPGSSIEFTQEWIDYKQ